ncbi:MAG: HEAT repeat domain-containing protein [Planctomycetes bacterium]|nr:HEAT repeat domain-containing protein [Planctomycetota bacterium]
MNRTPLSRLAMVTALLLGAAIAQETKEPPVDPALPDQLKELKKEASDRKMEADFHVIDTIQHLAKDLDKKNPKDVEKIAKGIGDVFFAGKLREGNKDILYREAADALAKFGEDGAKELAKAVTHKRFKDNLGLQAHMMLALGKTEDDKQIDFLLETTTRSPHDELRAASGEALGNFTKAKLTVKRDIVKEIIRTWGGFHQRATVAVNNTPGAPVNFDPQNARKTLRACEGKWVATLQKLTGVSQTQFPDWQHWLNKNPGWEPPK